MALTACGRHQQQQAGQQQTDSAAHQRRRMPITQLTEQHAANNARSAEDQQQDGGKVGAKARHHLHKGFNVAVRRVMGRHHNNGKQVDTQQRRATHQQRQAFQRAGMLARQRGEQLNQAYQRNQRAHTNGEERRTPAEVLPYDAANRQTQHHRQCGTGGNQAQRLGAFTRWRESNSQRRGDRPEHRMGKGNADSADDQHRKIPRHKRQNMAGDEQHKQADQQPAPLHLAGQQHKRQGHQRHNPGVDGQHNAHLRRFHLETFSDVRQQPNRNKFCGVKNKRGDGQRDHA